MPIWSIKTLIQLMAKDFGLDEVWASPMEALFFQEADPIIRGLVCQYPIGRYRVDFAIPDEKIAIEIDGREFHSTADQLTKDARRQREIQSLGWTVIRFSGSEIYENAYICANKIRNLIGIRELSRRLHKKE
jgi:hypothetical protein